MASMDLDAAHVQVWRILMRHPDGVRLDGIMDHLPTVRDKVSAVRALDELVFCGAVRFGEGARYRLADPN